MLHIIFKRTEIFANGKYKDFATIHRGDNILLVVKTAFEVVCTEVTW
jgi:hypothetical protein